MSKVSILLSVYKPNEAFLQEQLLSLNAQTYGELELIVWNDCPDCPLDRALFERCITAFPLTLVDEKRNLGYIKAFEKLTTLADGTYVAYCDQDDVWEADKIAACVAALEKAGAVAAVCDKSIIDDKGNVTCDSVRHHSKAPCDTWTTGDDITARAAFRCYATGMSILARRDAVEACMPFSTYTGHDKWLMLCLSAAGRIAYVDRPLIRYRRYGKNVTGTLNGVNSKQDYYTERCATSVGVVEDFAALFPAHPQLPAMRACAAARMGKNPFRLAKYRSLIPETYTFEVLLALCPAFLFKFAKKILFG